MREGKRKRERYLKYGWREREGKGEGEMQAGREEGKGNTLLYKFKNTYAIIRQFVHCAL